jgi:hypothetical protein
MFDIFNGSDIVGKRWYSTKSNDSFVVKDVLMDESGNLSFFTTDNRTIDSSQLGNYIQSDTPINNIPKQQPKLDIDLSKLDSDTPITMVDEDLYIREPLISSNQSPWTSPSITIDKKEEKIDEDTMIIEKALKKIEFPQISCSFTWNEFPKKELSMLLEIMEIPMEKVLDYICKKAFTDKVISEITEQGKEYINCRVTANFSPTNQYIHAE